MQSLPEETSCPKHILKTRRASLNSQKDGFVIGLRQALRDDPARYLFPYCKPSNFYNYNFLKLL
jgi:hypothetical protein